MVTDPDGRVLESWRGGLKPGEVVRLGPNRLTPANALPLGWFRLSASRTLSGCFGEQDAAWRGCYGAGRALLSLAPPPAGPRLVLFLRKDGSSGPGAVWMPAAAPPTRLRGEMVGGEPPQLVIRTFPDFDPNPDFTTSAALVEDGRLLARDGFDEKPSGFRVGSWRRREPTGQLAPLPLTLAELKQAAAGAPAEATAAKPARVWVPVE